ncbi:MAG TPA: universal stress protein [Fodinibius sp.]|nr:universal stress protein [Fodinibius sp.]
MQPIKKILVPTDFSDRAEPAYKHSEEIACRFGARVDFIHIIPTLKYFQESMARLGAPLDMEGEIYPKAQQKALRQLDELMDIHLEEEHKGEAICKIGRKPSARILAWARENTYDLIVMASRGKHNTHLLRGSTAEQMIRYSPIPVFNVDTYSPSDRQKRLVLPTDGSMISLSALPMALTLADIYEAEIAFYHVKELYGSPLDDDQEQDPGKSEEAHIHEVLIRRMEEYLSTEKLNIRIIPGEADFENQLEISDGASTRTVRSRTVIEKRVTAHVGIENYARDHADFVVMATHGHSGWAHLFLGSTTEKVAQYLDLPVVTVKPPASRLKEQS